MRNREGRAREDSPLPPYRYQDLRSPTSIRLLKLRRTLTWRGRVSYHAELVQHELTACPPFTALSYVWGDPTDTVPFECEGKTMQITRSCNGALSQMVRRSSKRLIWVDAICINQKNDPEKSIQVAMMCEIYTTAQHVMIWLGPGSPACREGMQRLQRCSWVHRLALWEGPLRKWRRQKYMHYIERGLNDQSRRYEQLPGGTIGEVLSNEWFERLWCLQEAGLPDARKVGLYCGSEHVRFDAVMDFADFAMGKDPRIDPNIFGRTAAYCASLPTVRYAKIGDRGADHPMRLLIVANQKRATNPADYIYGTYGISTYNGLKPAAPDYSKSVSEVFVEATRFCIEEEGNISIIAMVGEKNHVLPSWVPDFSVVDYSWTSGEYRAAGSSPQSFLLDDSSQRLGVKGVLLETVAYCGPAIPLAKGVMSPRFHALKNDLLLAMKVAMPAWVELARQHSTSKENRHELMDQLTWTLSLEERPNENETPAMWDIETILWHLQNNETRSPDAEEDLEFMVSTLAHRLTGRRFFVTNSGRIGLGPAICDVGDSVALFSGLRLPFIVRAKGDAELELIGWTFVYGIMAGQAWPEPSGLQDFTLV